MTDNSINNVDSLCIDCGEVMDISVVTKFRALLLEALDSRQSIVLDASQVERADTAALQVLSAFVQDAGTQHQDVQWKDPTQALHQSAALLGLSDILHLQQVTD